MLSLTLSSDGPLADQIVTGIKRQIDDRLLRPGTRLPSIRSFAGSHKVSRFTVRQYLCARMSDEIDIGIANCV